MAIKIGGTTTIDDSRNLNAGVGTFYDIDFPLIINTFSPSIGQTNVELNTNIILTFNQTVGISSTTANITIRQNSSTGTAIATIGVGSTSVTISGAQVIIDPPINLGVGSTYYPVIDAGAFKSSTFGFGNVSTALTTYYFTTRSPNSVSEVGLGGVWQGGYVICKNGGTAWIVAPNSSQVTRNWYSRGDANTTAQACTGVTGWFVPTCGQLQNPGYNCRTYWDTYNPGGYWSDTENTSFYAFLMPMFSGSMQPSISKALSSFVRAFRCVSY